MQFLSLLIEWQEKHSVWKMLLQQLPKVLIRGDLFLEDQVYVLCMKDDRLTKRVYIWKPCSNRSRGRLGKRGTQCIEGDHRKQFYQGTERLQEEKEWHWVTELNKNSSLESWWQHLRLKPTERWQPDRNLSRNWINCVKVVWLNDSWIAAACKLVRCCRHMTDVVWLLLCFRLMSWSCNYSWRSRCVAVRLHCLISLMLASKSWNVAIVWSVVAVSYLMTVRCVVCDLPMSFLPVQCSA